MRTPTGRTRVVGVIGDPVRHSISPAMHNAAFEACGLDWVYVPFPVSRDQGSAGVEAMRVLGIDGLNVTMPHKAAAAQACDEVSDPAGKLTSVNTVVRRDDGTLFGDSTDGEGLLRSLREEGVEVRGRRVLVFGAGGAARAVGMALVGAGAAVEVAARRPEAAEDAAGVMGATTGRHESWAEALEECDVYVNATPLGMQGEPPPFDVSLITPDHVVVDLVYTPALTPLLEVARERGARSVRGMGMLVHQAALSFTMWTGVQAPVDVMREAAEEALG